MDDTHPLIKEKVRRRLMSLSGENRMILSSGLFDSAREMVLASLPKGLTDSELKLELLHRFYGHDFNERQFADIVQYFQKLV